MRITTVTITQRANIGAYEHLEVSAQVIIDDTDNAGQSTQAVLDYVDWFAQKPNRDAKRRQLEKELADPAVPTERKQKIEAWMADYKARQEKAESI